METKIVYSEGKNIGLLEGENQATIECQYIKRYLKNRDEIIKKNEWKSMGFGAKFMGNMAENIDRVDEFNTGSPISINGLSFVNNGERLIYSVSIENSSGILMADLKSDGSESHIIHEKDRRFHNLDYNEKSQRIILSVEEGPFEQNLALINELSSNYQMITEGDTLDENPVWSKRKPDTIYYNSTGIARNHQGAFCGFGPKVINQLDLISGDLDEIHANPKYDYFMPKVDSKEQLYCLKKPYNDSHKSKNIFLIALDVLLIPFRLIYAIMTFLYLFTMRYTGKPLTSVGSSTKAKKMDEEQLFINGNLIKAQKALKENKLRGDKYPGIAPNSWELIKLHPDGKDVTVKKGVLDYDINANGDIIFSNGKYLIQLNKDGSETVLLQQDLLHKIKVL